MSQEGILGPAQRGQVDPGRLEKFLGVGRAGVGGVEDDRRPPVCRLHDLERRRQFAIKLGHLRALSLAPSYPAQAIRPEKRMFYEGALSVITTNLPSEKRLARAGTRLKTGTRPTALV